MERVCRTCMSPNELHPLFPEPKHYESFERALFLSTGLQIKLNDGLPQNICYNCSTTIESIMRFRSQSRSTEKKLIKYMKHKSKFKSSKSELRNSDDKDDKIAGTSIKIEYEPTQEILVEVGHLASVKVDTGYSESDRLDKGEKIGGCSASSDIDGSPNSPASPFLCPGRENEDVSKSNTSLSFYDILEPRERNDPYTCMICKKTVTTAHGFELHSMVHLGYDFLCEFCGLQLHTVQRLLRHLRAKHGLARDNKFPCSFCDFKALDKEMKESHERRNHTKERPFMCNDCGKSFYTKRVLQQHCFSHMPDKPFECEECSKKFKKRATLNWHIKTAHRRENQYRYSCYICQKMYNSTDSTRKHIRKVHGIQKCHQGKLPRTKREDF